MKRIELPTGRLRWPWALAGLGAVFAAYRVYTLRWVCDDAFISFRYAKNMASGLGPVFNAGERVEGYTNFLWVLMASLGMRLHLDPVSLTMMVGALCYFGTAGLLLYVSGHLDDDNSARTTFVPMALFGWLVTRDAQVWATSGLETASMAFLVTCLFVVLVLASRTRHYVAAGSVLTLALMSRPDSLIYAACVILFVALERKHAIRHLTSVFIPVVLIYVPYWLWRFHYYGFPFPNTYYAKSANLPYWSQGLLYLRVHLESYFALSLVLPAMVYLGWRLRPGAAVRLPDAWRRAALLAALLSTAHLLYLARVGGDYMFARMLIPIFPVLLFVIELAWRLWVIPRRYDLVAATALSLLLILRWDPYTQARYRYEVVDEWRVYPRSWHDISKIAGKLLKDHLHGVPIRVVAGGERMAWAYYSDLPVVLEGSGGLTDTALAHQPLATRGRPGHEKWATAEFLEKHGYHLVLSAPYYDEQPIDSLRRFVMAGLKFSLITYDRDLMEQLRNREGIQFVHLPSYMDSLLTTGETTPIAVWQERYRFFRRFYFDHNRDPIREQAMEAKLQGA